MAPRLTRQERDRRLTEQIEKINASRIKKGVCRHCGGPVPCWSSGGDQAVGVRHNLTSWRSLEKVRINKQALDAWVKAGS